MHDTLIYCNSSVENCILDFFKIRMSCVYSISKTRPHYSCYIYLHFSDLYFKVIKNDFPMKRLRKYIQLHLPGLETAYSSHCLISGYVYHLLHNLSKLSDVDTNYVKI